MLGSGENVNIDVKVENSGEDAFEAAYYLVIPTGVTYAKMERLDKDTADTLIYCSITNRFADGNSTLRCDLGNPMATGQKVRRGPDLSCVLICLRIMCETVNN